MKKILVVLALFALTWVPVSAVSRVTTLLYDTFTDSDNTHLEAHTMNTGPGWDNLGSATTGLPDAGALQIESNAATTPTPPFYLTVYTADAGQADVTFTLDMTLPNANNYLSIASVRVTDRTHWCAVIIERDTSGTPYLAIYEKAGVGAGSILTQTNITGATNSTVGLTIVTSGTSIDATASTSEHVNSTACANTTATGFGLMTYADGTYANAVYDNFLVTNGSMSPSFIPAIINAPVRGGGRVFLDRPSWGVR